MLSVELVASEDDHYMDQRQKRLERHARRLAAAWSDFDTVEQSAIEVIRRFGAIEPRDLGVMRLHKDPAFVALQTACVVSYVRPFAAGLERVALKYVMYPKIEWQELHEDLFVWKERLAGEGNIAFRQFVVAQERASKNPTDRFVIGEATPILEPLKDFTALREMCANRKAILWPDLQNALAECYPVLPHPVLLSLGNIAG